jgi:hypothetical protein
MNLEEARALVKQCRMDRVAAQIQMSSARATIESTSLILQGLVRRFPELIDDTTLEELDLAAMASDGPSTAEGTLQILQVDEGQLYTVREMVAALDERGWLPRSDNPPNVVRTALERLRSQNRGIQKFANEDGIVAYCFSEPPNIEEPF